MNDGWISRKKAKEVASVSICIILVWLKCSGKMLQEVSMQMLSWILAKVKSFTLKSPIFLGSRYGLKCRSVGIDLIIIKSSRLKCQPGMRIPKSIIRQLWPQVELIQHSSMFWCFLKPSSKEHSQTAPRTYMLGTTAFDLRLDNKNIFTNVPVKFSFFYHVNLKGNSKMIVHAKNVHYSTHPQAIGLCDSSFRRIQSVLYWCPGSSKLYNGSEWVLIFS